MTTPQDEIITSARTKSEIRDLLESNAEHVLVIDTELLTTVKLPEGATVEFPFLLDGHLLLLQPDGSLIVFLNSSAASVLLDTGTAFIPITRLFNVSTSESAWDTIADVTRVPLHFIVSQGTPLHGSANDLDLIVGDPLIGLEINPLLPPTDYGFGAREDRLYFGQNDGTSQLGLEIVLRARRSFSRNPTAHCKFVPQTGSSLSLTWPTPLPPFPKSVSS